MTKDEIMTLDMEQIEARSQELAAMIDGADREQFDAIEEEVRNLEERRAEILAEIEQRKKDVAEVVKGVGDVIEKTEERKHSNMEIRNTPEYVNAFAEYSNISFGELPDEIMKCSI